MLGRLDRVACFTLCGVGAPALISCRGSSDALATPSSVDDAGTADVSTTPDVEDSADGTPDDAGTEPEVERRTRLYRLGQLVPPDPAPSGRARVAVADDRELLFDWHHRFHREVGEEIGDRTTIIDDRISYGGLSLWEVDAVPVAMAGRTRVSAGMIRLGPVFTPVELRSRGYGAAVTAAVSATAQQLADEVLLFTDLTNPISNAIYQRLGYQPVHDRWVVHCG